MPYPTEDNIANPCIKMKEQIKINAEKIIPSSASLVTFYASYSKVNFLKMMQNKMSVDVKFICKILILL